MTGFLSWTEFEVPDPVLAPPFLPPYCGQIKDTRITVKFKDRCKPGMKKLIHEGSSIEFTASYHDHRSMVSTPVSVEYTVYRDGEELQAKTAAVVGECETPIAVDPSLVRVTDENKAAEYLVEVEAIFPGNRVVLSCYEATVVPSRSVV